jgi:DNA-directed RNA polymerase beta subunit
MSEDEAPYRVREYNRNHRGYTCCYETSDSKAAGLNKVLAWTCLITRSSPNPAIVQQVKFDSSGIPVFHNGRMIGYIDNPCDDLSNKKPDDTWSMYVKQGVLCIHNDVGRLTRPMLYKGNKIMVDMGEYIKFHNELDEIYPSSILGLSALLTTFPHMSPGPRNNYQTSMNKQAISWCPSKLDSTRHEEKVLACPDMPYVLTDFAKHYLENFLDLRHTNVVVAVMSDMYNNEDAIIINKGAVQRGLFSNIKIINERVFLKETSNRTQNEIKQLRTGEKVFIRTSFDTNSKSIIYEDGKYSKEDGDSYTYNEDGSISPWNIVSNGSIIQTMLDTTKIQPRRDFKYEQIHPMVTFRNRIHKTDQLDEVYSEIIGFRFRIPEPGDKFATDISQKGVCAILKDECDMIQLPDGTIPHIIINPHGFPSRMTVGTLLNMAIGKYLCRVHDLSNIKEHLQSMNGCEKLKNMVLGWKDHFHSVNASIFRNIDDLIEIMKEYDVGENVFHGSIGLWTEKPVYYGILPYIALKQQIDEKSAARLTGPIVPMTGQPILGRKKGGGSALGEMEVNALIAYDAMGILHERMTLIDQTNAKYCPTCFLINVIGDECSKCKGKMKLINSRTSFITFVHLLYSMGLLCKIDQEL